MKLSSLEELQIPNLEPEPAVQVGISPSFSYPDIAERLKDINHSILFNFLQLVDLLATDPTLVQLSV